MRVHKSWIAVLLATGCSSYSVQKIPYPFAYPEGTQAEIQRAGDAIQGFRYYLPRPYVVVKKEFPVFGGTATLSATVDGQGRIRILGDPPPELGPLSDAKTLPPGRVFDLRRAAPSGGVSLQAGEAGSKEPEVTLVADANNLLDKSAVSDAQVPSRDAVVRLTVKVSKDLESKLAAGSEQVLLMDRLYLVPVVAGSHNLKGMVELAPLLSTSGAVGADRTLVAQVVGAKVPAFSSLGVAVDFKKDGKDQRAILHRKEVDITSTFAGEQKPTPSTGPDKPTEEARPKEVRESKASTSGDPTTDPLVWKGDLYDILLLPDFSEQYAISTKSGLSVSKADIGLENGWMLEKANVEIDNTNIGELITDATGKIVEAAIGKWMAPAKAAATLAEKASEVSSVELQSGDTGPAKFLVRVDWVDLAVPGIYPLLKESEQSCGTRCAPKVMYSTRREFTFSVLRASEANSSTPVVSPSGSTVLKNLEDVAVAGDTYAQLKNLLALFTEGAFSACGARATGDLKSGFRVALSISPSSLKGNGSSGFSPDLLSEMNAAILKKLSTDNPVRSTKLVVEVNVGGDCP